MAHHPVEAVWVWRFTKTPFKATYGRLGDTTYTKDYLQPIGECARTLDIILGRGPGQAMPIRFEWPGGSRDGSLFEAADYDANGRLDLRWETDNAPDPWRLYPIGSTNPVMTFPGNPDHTTPAEANLEFEKFAKRNLDPWIVVVKLFGEADVLHVRAYLGRPPPHLAHTSVGQLPGPVVDAMARVRPRGGCAAVVQAIPSPRASVGSRLLFDPTRVHDAWLTSPMTADAFRELVERERGALRAPAAARPRPFIAYRRPDTSPATAPAKVFTRDPDEVDRGLRGHNVTQEVLAEHVRSAGLKPGSSQGGQCDFDLAWERGGIIHVAEVKSLTRQNERLQLRLGLGQVLDYAYRLRASGWTVQPVLAVEREPADPIWVEICADQGVLLVWPDVMPALFEAAP